MRDEAPPACPFCGAPWSAAMLSALDAATDPAGCGCCTGATATHAPRPLATADIACQACGKPIYCAVRPPAG